MLQSLYGSLICTMWQVGCLPWCSCAAHERFLLMGMAMGSCLDAECAVAVDSALMTSPISAVCLFLACVDLVEQLVASCLLVSDVYLLIVVSGLL